MCLSPNEESSDLAGLGSIVAIGLLLAALHLGFWPIVLLVGVLGLLIAAARR